MSDYFKLNNNFLGTDGIIGRRGFITNFILIELIASIVYFLLPIFLFFFNQDLFFVLLEKFVRGLINEALLVKVWSLVVGVISGVLYFSNIVRRVRDILGEENDNRIYLISSVLVVLLFSAYTPLGANIIFMWASIFVLMFLMIAEGKISSAIPHNPLLKFNWGAFFGNWIWGIVNRVPAALLALPLFLVPGGFMYIFYCGIKGNEWIYNRRHIDDPEKFHKSQASQSIIFTVLSPLLFILVSAIIFTGTALGVSAIAKVNPQFANSTKVVLQKSQMALTASTFNDIKLTDNEYKFYIFPGGWDDISDMSRIAIFRNAVDYVDLKKENRRLNSNKSKYSEDDALYFLDIAKKTKIYSSFNEEVLIEFDMSQDEYKAYLKEYESKLKNKKDAFKHRKELMEDLKKGYKINRHPSK